MRLILGSVAAAALALPAVAQDAADYGSMTCTDFAALDEAGMMAAAEGLQASMASGGDTSADPAGEMTADSNESAEDMDDATVAEGGASDAPAAADTGDMASAGAATADAGATGGRTGDPMMAALSDACASDPSMTLSDAMTGMGAGGTATN